MLCRSMSDPKLRQYFSLGERFSLSLKSLCCGCCSDSFSSTTDKLVAKNKMVSKFPKEKYSGKIMKLAINCTGLLELDEKVIHPFVRIHFIDMKTGKYLAKSRSDVPSVSNKENTTVIQHSNPGLLVRNIESDFIPPFATRYCDFRITGENRAEFYGDE